MSKAVDNNDVLVMQEFAINSAIRTIDRLHAGFIEDYNTKIINQFKTILVRCYQHIDIFDDDRLYKLNEINVIVNG